MKSFFRFVTTFIFVGTILGIGLYGAQQRFFIEPEEAQAGAADNASGWAWAENIGWVSFNRTDCDANDDGLSDGTPAGCPSAGTAIANYGVNIDPATGNFSGYAWSENVGWIKFNPTSTKPGLPSYSACLDLPGAGQPCDGVGDNLVSGWARACAAVADKTTCEGVADPAAGGWDGWIKMRGETSEVPPKTYGVKWNSSTKELEGWAWSDMVIGWISFNSKDCDADGNGFSDGTPSGCPVAGTPIPTYKVVANVNRPPNPGTPATLTVDPNPPATGSTVDSGTGICQQVTKLQWTYSDPDGNPQQAAQVQVDEASQGTFATPVVDKTLGPVTSVLLTHGIDFPFGGSWVWRVRVQDSLGEWSSWVQDDTSFTTISHALPSADFTFSPAKPSAKEPIQFTDTSSAATGFSIAARQWDFLPDGTPLGSIVKNPFVTFLKTGTKQIKLKVTDSATPALSCGIDTAQLGSGDPRQVKLKSPFPKFFPVVPF